jgi:hypothetical protein
MTPQARHRANENRTILWRQVALLLCHFPLELAL